MKGLILAGGSGTRLRPLTHTGPKQLIPIANKPVILYALEDLKRAGILDIGVILGLNMPEQVVALLGDGSKFGVKINYINQGEPKGIAHAVACAQEFIGGEDFAVYLGDNILKGGITAFVKEFISSKPEAGILLARVKNPERFGVAEMKGGKVVRLVEKPSYFISDLALVGVYLFKPSIFDVIKTLKPSWRNELEITEAIDKLMHSGKKVQVHVVSGWWKDTGKPDDILEANHLVLDDIEPYNHGTVEEGAEVRGKVCIGEGTVVRKGSVIRGPAIIGRNCEITNAYIGPYTSIGDNTAVKNSDVEASIIVGEARIECGKKIVDSLIGKNSYIFASSSNLPKGYRLIIGENSSIGL